MSQPRLTAAVRRLRDVLIAGDGEARSDADLLRAFTADRDADAFTALVGRYRGLVLGACRRVLGHEQDAEDACQATFLVLAKKAAGVRRGESLAAWLHGTARRIALRASREASRRRTREGKAAAHSLVCDPTDELTWREVRDALDEEIERLPVTYRGTFLLCCVEGVSHADAARRLGIAEGSVASRLTRARHRLHERLKRRGIELSAVLGAIAIASTASAAGATATAWAVLAHLAGKSRLSANVLTLAEGATKTMFGTRTTLAALLLLVGGLLGSGIATSPQSTTAAPEPPRLTARPGDGKDQQSPRKPSGEVEVSGRVLDADGKPLKGSKVLVAAAGESRKDVPPRAVTDGDGKFRFRATKAEVDRNETVVAAAEGRGPDWLRLQEIKGEVMLRLVEDVPIAGRVFDLEGKPVAGAGVRVWGLRRLAGDTLDEFLKDVRAAVGDREAFWTAWAKHGSTATTLYPPVGPTLTVTTDREGRFRLIGFGRERIVSLVVEGESIAHSGLNVLTRTGPIRDLPPGAHAASFNHLAGPGKVIRGVVKDRKSGKPLADVRVGAQADLEGRMSEGTQATTDKDGRFTLRGLPKAKTYAVSAGAVPFIRAHKTVADTPGLEPVCVELELEKALALKVRVIDKVTGRPVRAMVQYSVRGDNPSLLAYDTFPRNVLGWDVTDADGRRTETVIPGPAVIAVQAVEGEYTRSLLEDKNANEDFLGNLIPTPLWFHMFHAVVPVNPDPKDPKSLEVVVSLDPGRSVQGNVVGPDGKPVEGAAVAGLKAVVKASERNEAERLGRAEFKAVGLEPEYPRQLVFYHEGRKIARAVTLRSDEKEAVTVKLEPFGSLGGRVVDVDGKPVEGAEVLVGYHPEKGVRPAGELIFGGKDSLREALAVRPAKTGKDGTFRLEGLIPGMKYDLAVKKGKRIGEWAKRGVTAVPGKTTDLGDVRER